MYSGKTIPLEELFKPGYDIDHILPYSITFDDSFRDRYGRTGFSAIFASVKRIFAIRFQLFRSCPLKSVAVVKRNGTRVFLQCP